MSALHQTDCVGWQMDEEPAAAGTLAPEPAAPLAREHCPACTSPLPLEAIQVVRAENRVSRECHRVLRAYCGHCNRAFAYALRWNGCNWELAGSVRELSGAALANARQRAERFSTIQAR